MRRSFKKIVSTALAAVTVATSLLLGNVTINSVLADDNYDVFAETKYSNFDWGAGSDSLLFYNQTMENDEYKLDVNTPVKYVNVNGKAVEIPLKNEDGTAKYGSISGSWLVSADGKTSTIILEDGTLLNADLKYEGLMNYDAIGLYFGRNGDGTYTVFDAKEKVIKADFKLPEGVERFDSAFEFGGYYFFEYSIYDEKLYNWVSYVTAVDSSFNYADFKLSDVISRAVTSKYIYVTGTDNKLYTYDKSLKKQEVLFTLPEDCESVRILSVYGNDKDLRLYLDYADKNNNYLNKNYRISTADNTITLLEGADSYASVVPLEFRDGDIYRISDDKLIATAEQIKEQIVKLHPTCTAYYNPWLISNDDVTTMAVMCETPEGMKNVSIFFTKSTNYEFDKAMKFDRDLWCDSYSYIEEEVTKPYYVIYGDGVQYAYFDGKLYENTVATSYYGFVLKNEDGTQTAYDRDGNVLVTSKNLYYIWRDGYIVVTNDDESKLGLIGPKLTTDSNDGDESDKEESDGSGSSSDSSSSDNDSSVESGVVSTTEAATIQEAAKVEGTGVPEGSKLTVTAITEKTESYKAVKKYVVEKLKEEKFATLDLKLVAQDTAVQPNGKIKITLPVMENIKNAKKVEVYRLNEETNVLDKVDSVEVKDGKFTFETDHFSTYVFVEVPPTGDSTSTTMLVLLAGAMLLSMAAFVVLSKKRA